MGRCVWVVQWRRLSLPLSPHAPAHSLRVCCASSCVARWQFGRALGMEGRQAAGARACVRVLVLASYHPAVSLGRIGCL
ncbi:hypothetical protein EON67_08385 [archaeon]|nr:MAG: hypothetical protein EON67_08385 [archaeon]